MKKYSILYKNDVKFLRKNSLVLVNCPACKSKKYNKLFSKMNFNFVSCTKCSTVFVNPRPSENSLKTFYSSSKSIAFWDKIFRKTELTRKKRIFTPRIKLVLHILKVYGIKQCKKMVEVGPGYGWFCQLAKKQNLANKITVIEPSPSAVTACKKIKGIEIIESTIEDYYDQISADLIVGFELLNYLYNPRSFLEACYQGLTKGGVVIFTLTNYFGLDIQILKEKSDYFVPTHLTLFNPNSIEFLLSSVGFKKIKVITPGLMDVKIILNKIKSGSISSENYPFFKFLEEKNSELIDDLQLYLQKHKMSSHMMVSAIKC